MTACDSLSKGAFAFNGRKRKLDVGDYLVGSEGSRYAQAQQVWLRCSSVIQEIQDASYASVFDDICSHITSSYALCEDPSYRRFQSVLGQLPAVALVGGASVPDHAYMFARLADVVRLRASCRVATLRSKDCGSLRSLMNSVIVQLATAVSEQEADGPTQIKAAQCTVSCLESWHKRVAGGCRQDSAARPLVIVFEDFESFENEVLQDFISTCGYRMKELPTVLIFGLATDVTALHRLLPNSVTSMLTVQKFQAVSSSDTLSKLLELVLLRADAPFKLGSKVYELLLDVFLYHDFSISSFARCFRFCVLDHFLASSSSCLCCDPDETAAAVRSLGQQQLDELLALPSVRAFVESKPDGEKVQLLKDAGSAKKVIEQLAKDMHDYHRRFFVLLRILRSLTSELPGCPLGRHLRELYLLSLTGVTSSDGYKLSLGLLKNLCKDELVSHLTRCIGLVANDAEAFDPISLSLHTQLAGYVDRLHNVGRPGSEECSVSVVLEPLPKKLDMYTLRKTLLEQRPNKASHFEKLRAEIFEFLDAAFRDGLKPYSSRPLHEVYYYSSVASVRQHCNASPRMAIQSALAKPFYYLENESCNVGVDSIVPSLPDSCIAYKLHLQCGRLINLHDWMLAFAAVCDDQGSRSDRKQAVSSVTQARFVRAVSELQFLGFIKPTKSKTDHVTRLTWGSW